MGSQMSPSLRYTLFENTLCGQWEEAYKMSKFPEVCIY